MDWLIARLKEPSSLAAIAALGALVAPLVPEPYGAIAVTVLAALGFAKAEKKAE